MYTTCFTKFNNVKYANKMRQLGHALWKEIKSTYILPKNTALSNSLTYTHPLHKQISIKRIHYISSYHVCFTPPCLFFFGENSTKSIGTSGQGTSLLFCLCMNFPLNASSCLLSQGVASSLTRSQKNK